MCSVFPHSTCRSVACDFKKRGLFEINFLNVFERDNACVYEWPVWYGCTLSGSIFGNKFALPEG